MLNLKVVPSWCMLLLISLFVEVPLQNVNATLSNPYVSSASQDNDATQSVYVPYTPTVSPVGAVYAPSLATTAGNTPYAYSAAATDNSPYGSSTSGFLGISGPQLYGFGGGGFGSEDEQNRSNENPVGEAWALLFLAAGYACYILAKRKKQQQTQEQL